MDMEERLCATSAAFDPGRLKVLNQRVLVRFPIRAGEKKKGAEAPSRSAATESGILARPEDCIQQGLVLGRIFEHLFAPKNGE